MIHESEEVPGVSSTEAEVALINAYVHRKLLLEKQAKSGQIDLIIRQIGNIFCLFIVDNKGKANPSLAQVLLASDITMEELSIEENPWEMIIFDDLKWDPTTNKRTAAEEIAKRLPAFFRSFYPTVTAVPISIYASGTSYRENQPLTALS